MNCVDLPLPTKRGTVPVLYIFRNIPAVKLQWPDSPERLSSFYLKNMGLWTVDYTHSLNDCSRNSFARVTSLSLGCKCRLGNAGQRHHVTMPKHEHNDDLLVIFNLAQKGGSHYNWPGFSTTTGEPHSRSVKNIPWGMCCRGLIVTRCVVLYVCAGGKLTGSESHSVIIYNL